MVAYWCVCKEAISCFWRFSLCFSALFSFLVHVKHLQSYNVRTKGGHSLLQKTLLLNSLQRLLQPFLPLLVSHYVTQHHLQLADRPPAGWPSRPLKLPLCLSYEDAEDTSSFCLMVSSSAPTTWDPVDRLDSLMEIWQKCPHDGRLCVHFNVATQDCFVKRGQ